MALLPYADQNAAASQQQQQQAGLLNDPMMSMMILSKLMGGRRRGGGGSNALQMMMQIQNQEEQAKRQAQQDAIAQERLGMDKAQFGMQQQMYQQKLAEAQQEQVYNKQLADMIMKGGQSGPEQLAPPPLANNIPSKSPALDPSNMLASNGAGVPQGTDIGQRLQKTMIAPDHQQELRPEAQAVKAEDNTPQLFAELRPNPQENTALDMQRRQMAAALAQAGKTKDAFELLQKQPETGVDKAMVGADIEALKKSREASGAALSMLPDIRKFKTILSDVSDRYVGPLIGNMGTTNQVLEPRTQQLNQLGNSLALQARSLYGMPGNMSDKDLAFLKGMTLNTSYDKPQLMEMADQLERLSKKAVMGTKYKEMYLKKHGTLQGADSEWLQKNDAIEAQAQEAIQKGADPRVVKERLEQMRGY